MRDPGIPRRNPLFDHTFDEDDERAVPFAGGPGDRPEPVLRALDDASAWSDDFDWGDDPFTDPYAARDAEFSESEPWAGAAGAPGDPLSGLTGIVAAVKTVGVSVPVIVRLEGTNAELARQQLASSGLAITPASDLTDAATKAVRLAAGR